MELRGRMFLREISWGARNKKLVDPRTQPVSRTGVLAPKSSDKDFYKLTEEFGTPYFLIDEATLGKKVSEIEHGFTGFRVVGVVPGMIVRNGRPIDEMTMYSDLRRKRSAQGARRRVGRASGLSAVLRG